MEGKISIEHLGRKVKCGGCAVVFKAPRHLRLPCPGCSETLRVRPEALGLRVSCKKCDATFIARLPKRKKKVLGRSQTRRSSATGALIEESRLREAEQRLAEALEALAERCRAVERARLVASEYEVARDELAARQAEIESDRDRLTKEHAELLDQLNEVRAESDGLRSELIQHQAAAASWSSTQSKYDLERESFASEREQLAREKAAALGDLEAAFGEREADGAHRYARELADVREGHEAALLELREAARKELTKLAEESDSRLAAEVALREEKANDIIMLSQQHEMELRELGERHAIALEALRSELRSRVESDRAAHEGDAALLSRDYEQRESEREARVAVLEASLERERALLEERAREFEARVVAASARHAELEAELERSRSEGKASEQRWQNRLEESILRARQESEDLAARLEQLREQSARESEQSAVRQAEWESERERFRSAHADEIRALHARFEAERQRLASERDQMLARAKEESFLTRVPVDTCPDPGGSGLFGGAGSEATRIEELENERESAVRASREQRRIAAHEIDRLQHELQESRRRAMDLSARLEEQTKAGGVERAFAPTFVIGAGIATAVTSSDARASDESVGSGSEVLDQALGQWGKGELRTPRITHWARPVMEPSAPNAAERNLRTGKKDE
jgi:hypothetical protein